MKRTWKNRSRVLIVAFLLVLASMVPVTTAASSHEATRVDATIRVTNGEPANFGTSWQDANGGFHLRDQISIDQLEGDISGTVTSLTNVDVSVVEGCAGEECPFEVHVWGDLDVVDETGTWTGQWVETISTVPGEEFDIGYVMLSGRGGNLGKSFFGQITESDEMGGTIAGAIFTMATPVGSLDLSAMLCFSYDGGEVYSGGYLSSGVIEGSGSAVAEFLSTGTEGTHNGNIYGNVEIADASGSLTLEFIGGGQEVSLDQNFVGHAFGTYLITGGTGAYSEVFGQGRVIGTASALPQCSSGFGVRVQFIGEAHVN